MQRVLVIEPDAVLAQGLKHLLSKHGFHVETAGNGEAGLQAYSQGRYAVVTTAFRLGSLNALDFARAIKASCPHQPIVLISSAGYQDSSNEDGRLFSAQVRKPFRMEELVGVISLACGGASSLVVPR